MNAKEALERLSLDEQATPETIEKTYRKLINRYPPEFQPEKFRRIDEAYRFLTSYPRMVEMLFAPTSVERTPDMNIFRFEVKDSASLLEAGMREIKRRERIDFLWEKDKDKRNDDLPF
jgi:hypothetical protein